MVLTGSLSPAGRALRVMRVMRVMFDLVEIFQPRRSPSLLSCCIVRVATLDQGEYCPADRVGQIRPGSNDSTEFRVEGKG